MEEESESSRYQVAGSAKLRHTLGETRQPGPLFSVIQDSDRAGPHFMADWCLGVIQKLPCLGSAARVARVKESCNQTFESLGVCFAAPRFLGALSCLLCDSEKHTAYSGTQALWSFPSQSLSHRQVLQGMFIEMLLSREVSVSTRHRSLLFYSCP